MRKNTCINKAVTLFDKTEQNKYTVSTEANAHVTRNRNGTDEDMLPLPSVNYRYGTSIVSDTELIVNTARGANTECKQWKCICLDYICSDTQTLPEIHGINCASQVILCVRNAWEFCNI
jgi:hypothetical protein